MTFQAESMPGDKSPDKCSRFNGYEFEQTPGDSEEQDAGGLRLEGKTILERQFQSRLCKVFSYTQGNQ